MKTWTRWILAVTVVAAPAAFYASRGSAAPTAAAADCPCKPGDPCPIKDGQPCPIKTPCPCSGK